MNENATQEQLVELERLLKEMRDAQVQRRMDLYDPNWCQQEFHANGKGYRQRLFMAGNRLGKTLAGGHEMAFHLTGQYPDWWAGRRFDKPVRAWMAGIKSSKVRDTQQKLLFGEPGLIEAFGTGTVPKDCIIGKPVPARGVANYFDTVYVRHVSGGASMVQQKSYEEGWENFQSDNLDVIWLDEEPDDFKLYTECLTRTNDRMGMLYVTFTPLKGRTDLVEWFAKSDNKNMCSVTHMTLDDVTHFTEDQKDEIRRQYPSHERDARLKGIPMLGSGRVFSVAEEAIVCDPFDIPAHWWLIVGLDVGADHPTAATLCAWDKDLDVFHVCADYAMSYKDAKDGQLVNVATHAAAINGWGRKIPVAWPKDAAETEKGSGKTVAMQYKDPKNGGLIMLPTHAQWPDKSVSVEVGIMEMEQRMMTGRWKVFKTARKWLDEFRYYRREEGKIVKLKDDVLCASRYAYMMRRYARQKWEIEDRVLNRKGKQRIASGVDYDVFG